MIPLPGPYSLSYVDNVTTDKSETKTPRDGYVERFMRDVLQCDITGGAKIHGVKISQGKKYHGIVKQGKMSKSGVITVRFKRVGYSTRCYPKDNLCSEDTEL